ncbi:MICAL-like protein 1 isoform X2 [Xiphophorus couchianus]|uniref:MICAL-like protein 1 isoform X2 n=1 Tax=Xiphophorus couchianus TaxID=32473 RepID=UPI0010171ECB|nr:MICAL-like protein 1 isoform X2 [Xiphophorus couchianus]
MAASPKALLEWCRVTCASYPAVEVKNMSASFRDGLAFCAIIHKHRPDLIDFSSLSRGNVYQNNKLAFEVAEAKLGIPPLLDPQDMVSTDAPDFLTVITYVSQYYNFFSGESPGPLPRFCPCRSWSSQVLNVTKVHKTLRSQKSLTELETSKEDGHAGLRRRAVCSLCFKPVHLIQKSLADGKVYHRGCFRCKVCLCVLLPGSYPPGSDQTSFICSHHATDRKAAGVDSERQLGSAGHRPRRPIQTGFYSLSGSAICSVPRYAEPRRATEGGGLPVPAPRRSLDSSVAPVPASRSRTAQAMSDSPAGESSPQPPGLSPKVKSNHPWMAIVHPGPWTQLPPAPPPVPVPRSKPISNTRTPWNRPRTPSLNPFEEEEEVDEAPKQEAASRTGPSAGPSEDSGIARVQGGEEPGSKSERKADGGRDRRACVFTEEREGAEPDPVRGATAGGNSAGTISGELADGGQNGPSHATEPRSSEAQRSAALPRSLSVPAMPSERSESGAAAAGLRDADRPVSACEGESACKEDPFSERPGMSRSQTVQNLSSTRGPAPGHGFPLIRRQVRTDRDVSTEDLQKQMRSLDGDLEALEQRGVELERSIRDGRTGKEEQMLTEWFGLVHEQHTLLRKNKELVYLTKQQILEDRQADVEYKLRCLLNKPEKDWDQEDRGREQQLMAELVTIIEQRNQIISSLDQDRERDEDMESTRNKSFQKDGPKKTKGKLKAPKVFKMLNHKPESSKEPVEKKS